MCGTFCITWHMLIHKMAIQMEIFLKKHLQPCPHSFKISFSGIWHCFSTILDMSNIQYSILFSKFHCFPWGFFPGQCAWYCGFHNKERGHRGIRDRRESIDLLLKHFLFVDELEKLWLADQLLLLTGTGACLSSLWQPHLHGVDWGPGWEAAAGIVSPHQVSWVGLQNEWACGTFHSRCVWWNGNSTEILSG